MKPKKTILCVDENEASLSIRKIMLETRGYRVLPHRNAEDALVSFRTSPTDLVLCEQLLPGADGAWLVAQVKSDAPRTPTILLTDRSHGNQYNTVADVLLTHGMWEPAHLLEHIRVLLIKRRSPKRSSQASVKQFDSRIGAA